MERFAQEQAARRELILPGPPTEFPDILSEHTRLDDFFNATSNLSTHTYL
jgi:hypothetical protein